MKTIVWIASLTAAIALGASAQAAIIVNGDFSNPNQFGGWHQYSSIPGWTNAVDSIEVGYSGVYGLGCANLGCQNVEVNSNIFGAVSQTITGLTVGKTYDLSWDYGGRDGGGPQKLNVSFGSAGVTTDSGSFGVWTLNSFNVKATASMETLTFASVNMGGLPSYGNEITNVALTAVPEPATWAMMMIGFAGLGFAGYRKTKKNKAAFAAA